MTDIRSEHIDQDERGDSSAAPHPDQSVGGSSPVDVSVALRHLLASVEPAVVFSSLARLSVTAAFSNRCTVLIRETGNAAYRITYPHPATDGAHPRLPITDPATDPRTVSIAIQAPALPEYPTYAGTVTYTWLPREPTHADRMIARLLSEHAVAAVHRERLAALGRHAQNTAANLHTALLTNRRIGTALGILMARPLITETAAFDLLRITSQHTHDKLRDVAEHVIQTGCLSVIPTRAHNRSRGQDTPIHPAHPLRPQPQDPPLRR